MTTAETAAVYALDPTHSSVGFSVRHMMLSKVKGHFTGISGTIELSSGNLIPTAVAADIDAATIDTREAQRDGHLKSADFLHVEEHPLLTFRSTAIAAKGETVFDLTGDLTIHGTTQPVTFDAAVAGRTTDPWGNDRVAYEASAKIDRKDFGLTWNQALETGGILVGDIVEITLDVQAILKK